LLAQDYPSIEILISDNASTDRTASIGQIAARASARVRYSRNPTNLGAIENFNVALRQATGHYFMWASDHDLWSSDFVSACVRTLESRSEAVLAYPETLLIDEEGREVDVMDDQIDADQSSALTRYKQLIWRLTICNMIYGVGRRHAMQATGGAPNVVGPDHLVLAKLALAGPILRVGGRRFYRRQIRSIEAQSDIQRIMVDLDPLNAAVRVKQPRMSLYRELRDAHLAAVRESGLSAVDKVRADLATHACFAERFGVPSLPVKLARRAARLVGRQSQFDRNLGFPSSASTS
jgi:glycosyltransferase involved in cell wall biosynthesis